MTVPNPPNPSDDASAGAAPSASGGSYGSAAVFAPVSAPVLRSVDPVRVAAFLKERERYELEIEAKATELPSLKPVAWTASIDRSLLRSLIYMGDLEAFAPGVSAKTITNEHLKSYITSLVSRDGRDYDPAVMNSALDGLKFPSGISNASARITSYCAHFFELLESVGYDDFRDDNPKQTAHLLLQRVQPAALRSKMFQRIKYDTSLEKSVPKLISKLKEEAIACQEYGEAAGGQGRQGGNAAGDSQGNKSNSGSKRGGHSSEKGGRQARDSEKHSEGSSAGSGSSSTPKEPPLCLWETHSSKGIRHFMKDCAECPADKRKELLATYHAKRKAERGAKRAASASVPNGASSVLFSADFAGVLCETLCADIGADANLMDADLLSRITDAGASLQVETLNPPRQFALAAETADGDMTHLVCQRAATMDVDVHIRHGTGLKIRNARWLVSNQRVPEPLLGRPLLEFLGLNTAECLAAAADRSAGVIDAQHLAELDSTIAEGRVSRVLEGVFHAEGDPDSEIDGEPYADTWCDLGDESNDEWLRHLQDRLNEARQGGISAQGCQKLEDMLREHRDIVRIRLDSRPPARVQPMSVHLKPDAVPVRAKPRRYPPQKREFLRRYTQELERLGFVKPAVRTDWVAAPLIVPKKPPAMFRLTMDYRPINSATQKTVWPMPHVDAVLSEMRGARCFASIDFCSGYWQLPLAEECQSLFAFMTCDGVVQPTRTTQGGCNSAANFQANVEPCFASLRDNLLAWLDDFVVHARAEKELLDKLRCFLQICIHKNLVISIIKSRFFGTSVEWCGRLIDTEGVQLNPANYQGLTDAQEPRTGAELSQYVHCANWMAAAIPRFAERVAPLRDLLEAVYQKAGKRTTKSIAKIPLCATGWGPQHVAAFRDVQEQLKGAVKTAHRDPGLTLCLYTDASDAHWAGVVTQCEPAQLREAIGNQKHQPLAFLGGSFTGAQVHWSTYEREAFAIIESIRKMDYMFACESSTVIFTDHRNLLFVFHPTAIERTLGRHKVLKVLRWALYLSSFTYRIEHVPGDQNVMADIMTRWLRGYRSTKSLVRRLKAVSPVPTAPKPDSNDWPHRSDILQAQRARTEELPGNAIADPDGLLRINGAAWIPEDAVDLKVRLLIIAHAGPAGHRGSESTATMLEEGFTWTGLRQDTADFVAGCLFCVLSKTGTKVPRPLASTLHGSRPNEVLHFDYLYLGSSTAGEMYALVLKDDLSGYTWLEPTASANAAHAASTLARWNRTFTSPDNWVSDQGGHFINETLQAMAKTHRISHRPTVAYAPWANGTVERLNRDILAAMRALIAELKLAPQDWTTVIALIPTILNEAPLSRLGKDAEGFTLSPLQVMTGIRPRRLLLRVLTDFADPKASTSLDRARAEQRINIAHLQTALDALHKDVSARVDARRKRAIEAHNRATHLVTPRFEVGDFVVVRQAERVRHKLSFKWAGPKRITGTLSPLVYLVERLDGTRRERVHCARLAKYDSNLDGSDVPTDVLQLADRSEVRYEVLSTIRDIGEEEGALWLRLEWDGLPDQKDWTWAPLADVYEDVPDMVEEFLKSSDNRTLAQRAADQLALVV